jgi:hypothetical protein
MRKYACPECEAEFYGPDKQAQLCFECEQAEIQPLIFSEVDHR